MIYIEPKINTCLLFLLFIFPLVLPAQEKEVKSERPSVGLVFSGGGAKGWAYIGLLRVIQEAGLPIDYIAGASAGSIVGGFYALGYHPDTMEMLIREQDWDVLMKDKIDRKYIAYEEKIYGGRYIFSIPIKNRKIGLKSSLYKGQNIDLLLNRYYSVAYKDTLFKDFQIPFVSVATDLITGEKVVIDQGYLPQAVRASMSIPAYFPPTYYDGKYLIDGGVVDNFPVTSLKELGVDIIVGADVQARDTITIEKLESLATILDHIIGYNRQEENEKSLKETDLYVHMRMKYNMMDFNNYDSIIPFGERVARDHFDEIKALADSLNAIEYKPVKSYTTVPLDSVLIDDVKYFGYDKMRRSFLETYFGDFEGKMVAISDLESQINYAYGSGFFETVFYELEYVKGKTNLLIKMKDSDPGSLSAGIHYDTDYKGAILINLTVRNLLVHRTKLFIDLGLGNYPLLRGLYVLDNGKKPGVGVDFDLFTFKFDTYRGSEKYNNWDFSNYSGSVFVPITVKNVFGFKAGFKYQYFRFKQGIVKDSILDGFNTFSSFGEIYISLGSDTRDKAYFPTRGSKTMFKVKYTIPLSKDWSEEIFDNTAVAFFKYNQNIRLTKRFTLQPGFFVGATITSNGFVTDSIINDRPLEPSPVQNWFWVGGLNQYNYLETMVPFTGLKFIQSQGLYAAIVRLNLQYNFYRKLYATAMLDVGQNEFTLDDFFKSENIMAGYGLKVSYNSFIGPVEGSIMFSNMLPGATFFLNIGFWL